MDPVIPSRKRLSQARSAWSLDLLRALADAAQSHAEGQVLAERVSAEIRRACVVMARVARGWQVVGVAGWPEGTVPAQLGVQLAGNVDIERWLRDAAQGEWSRRDLSHGRRVVARLYTRDAPLADELARACAVAGPSLAAAYPRPAGASPLELYLAQIVHDLRQPVSTLKLAHGLLSEGSGEPRLIERCQRAVRDLAELMDDLLAFAQPASAAKKRGHSPVRLAELLAQVVDDQSAHAQVRGVKLSMTVRADPTVLGSPLGLRRALANVIDNALDHSPAGGRVDVRLDVDFRETWIEVRDEGPGVAAALREQVFEPFFTTRSTGNGLGLAVVRLVAQAHGGAARFVDGTGVGATLRFSIPHQPAVNGLPV